MNPTTMLHSQDTTQGKNAGAQAPWTGVRRREAGWGLGLQEAGSGWLRTCPREAGRGDPREPRLPSLQNGYLSRDNATYLEDVFLFSKPIFQSDIKGGEEKWGVKAEPEVIECPSGDPSWPKAPV